jgi:hypothetical protein
MSARSLFGKKFVESFNRFGRRVGNTLGDAGQFGRKISTVASKVIDPLVNLRNQIEKDPTTRALAGLVPGYNVASSILNLAKSGNDTVKKISDTTSDVGGSLSRNNYKQAIRTVADNI